MPPSCCCVRCICYWVTKYECSTVQLKSELSRVIQKWCRAVYFQQISTGDAVFFLHVSTQINLQHVYKMSLACSLAHVLWSGVRHFHNVQVGEILVSSGLLAKPLSRHCYKILQWRKINILNRKWKVEKYRSVATGSDNLITIIITLLQFKCYSAIKIWMYQVSVFFVCGRHRPIETNLLFSYWLFGVVKHSVKCRDRVVSRAWIPVENWIRIFDRRSIRMSNTWRSRGSLSWVTPCVFWSVFNKVRCIVPANVVVFRHKSH